MLTLNQNAPRERKRESTAGNTTPTGGAPQIRPVGRGGVCDFECSVFITARGTVKDMCYEVRLLLQDLLQSCSRGGEEESGVAH